MTFISPDPVASGRPYPVSHVGDRPPHELSDFVGETAFTLSLGDVVRQVTGVGRAEADAVRFHEKDSEHTTKDVRVWQISGSGDAGFVAASVSAF